ncbi:enoyl-CoA hydratase [Falsibacillus pallidus]|uniref:Enoyl-CoA hydratase n=1 Tax=Falsibacillus pallidus TaxID=493781 RepID=A0A370H1G3_9BACI|nr:enoyl-CoA hydratase [Falsibacillus pallidus]RDI47883.1 enoyl-CoA hydratase [Falsibacillus pallidus]
MNFVESYKTLNVDVDGNIAYITMNRPKQLNALNEDLISEMAQCLNELKKSESVKILVLQGSGPAFSSGGDIKEMLQKPNNDDFFVIMDQIGEMIETLYTMPMLTVSCIQGAAAGLGLSLALASDYILADPESKIAMNFIGIGLIPDGAGHFLMENRLGAHAAKKVIWEGKVMTGVEAHTLGLIDQLVQVGSLKDELKSLLSKWSKKPLKAMIKTKTIYSQMNLEKLRSYLEHEKKGQYEMRNTKDHREGIQAFLEKRPPVFKGE